MMKPEESFALDNALAIYNPEQSYQEILSGLKLGSQTVVVCRSFVRFPTADTINLVDQMKHSATELLTPYRTAIQDMLTALNRVDPVLCNEITTRYPFLGDE